LIFFHRKAKIIFRPLRIWLIIFYLMMKNLQRVLFSKGMLPEALAMRAIDGNRPLPGPDSYRDYLLCSAMPMSAKKQDKEQSSAANERSKSDKPKRLVNFSYFLSVRQVPLARWTCGQKIIPSQSPVPQKQPHE